MRFALGLATIALISAGPSISRGQPNKYFLRSRTWCTSEYEVVVSCSLADSSRQIGWGFQPLAVECARRQKP